MPISAKAEDLRRSALFAGLAPSLLRGMSAGAQTSVLPRGSTLWAAGERASHVALVLTGRLKSVRRSGSREVILDIAMPGDVLGDVAFVLGEPHLASVVALRRSRVVLLPARALREAFASNPRALTSALFSLARRAQRLMRLVEGLSAGKVGRRLATVLVGLADRVGGPFPGGLLVPLRLRRADLGALAATSAESVSRHLVAWERRGLLQVLPAGYLIRDLVGLRQLADGRERA